GGGGQRGRAPEAGEKLDGVAGMAERARHAAAARLHRLNLETRKEPQRALDRCHDAQAFLVTMTVQQHPSRGIVESQLQYFGIRLRGQKFLERESLPCKATRRIAPEQRGDLVPESEQAARLETDDRNPAFDERRQCRNAALRFAPPFLHRTDPLHPPPPP